MSDLQIVLIIIGALIISAVLLINWWQERRFHQQVENNFSPLQSDALLDEFNHDDLSGDESQFKTNSNQSKFEADDSGFYNKPNKLGADLVDDFAYKKPSSEVDFSFDVKGMKDLSADFILPPAKNEANSEAIDLREKSTQHHDIKAIFKDAFNSSNKAGLEVDKEKINPYAGSNQANRPQENVFGGISVKEVFRKEPEFESADLHRSNVNEADTEISEFTTSNSSNTQNSDKTESSSIESNESEVGLPEMLNGQIDLTAILYLAEESQLDSLRDHLASVIEGYDKPVFVHVLQSSGSLNHVENQAWYSLVDALPNQLIVKIACSLQLADRAGAVSRYMLNRFQLAVETLGLDINAHVEWQSNGDALSSATALDLFCIDVDKTIGFHLVHGENGAFTGTKLRGLAEAQGFKLSSDGMFRYFDASTSESSFVMFNREDNPFSADMLRASVVKGITFQFDIPHIKQCAQAFSQMVQVARQMEIGLNAVLVDDNNRALGDIQIEKIRQQLKVIHATMLVRGIIPGSESALRLFS